MLALSRDEELAPEVWSHFFLTPHFFKPVIFSPHQSQLKWHRLRTFIRFQQLLLTCQKELYNVWMNDTLFNKSLLRSLQNHKLKPKMNNCCFWKAQCFRWQNQFRITRVQTSLLWHSFWLSEHHHLTDPNDCDITGHVHWAILVCVLKTSRVSYLVYH